MAGCRRGDLKWQAAIKVENSFSTQPSQDLNVKEAYKPHATETLLMRAGDVESNPGPKSKRSKLFEQEEDFDDILKDVARFIRGNRVIDTLGKALGFDPAEIERYIATNTRYQHVTYDGTLKMLRDWRDDQTKATERPVLADALRLAGLERLADIFLMTSTVPDLQTFSDDLSLEDDLLESVVNDIMKYYIFNMCTIQADPTNNDVMFEFDHIHTDPTLLEEDRNDNRIKKPLLYCNLLKTTINGHLPKRLLVQAEGGAGKTTFCAKIAWDWVFGLGFQQFKLVAVIPLHTAKNMTVGDIIKSYLSDNNPVTALQIDNYILSNPKDVFLAFDGLDELGGLGEFDEKLSDLPQIVKIILNRLFMSGTVLVTSRQWRVDKIRSTTELKKVYALIYLKGFSVDNVNAYITKFFHQDAASSQELIDFITFNDVIADNMTPFPIYIAMLCIMWREYEGERREAMSKLMTFSQLFGEMVDFLVDHCGSKDDSRTGHTVQELRKMIPNNLKAIGEIAFQGILDRRKEFPEDTFQNCRESMEMGCKVGVLTRVKHAIPRRDRRKNPGLQMFKLQFPHGLFQEFVAAKYLASLHSSDHGKYDRIMATILETKEENRYLLYFTSAEGSGLGLDIVTRLIAQEMKYDEPFGSISGLIQLMRNSKLFKISVAYCPSLIPKETTDALILDELLFYFIYHMESSSFTNSCTSSEEDMTVLIRSIFKEEKDHFIVDVAYESQDQSVAEQVGHHLMRGKRTLKIIDSLSTHTLSGLLFIKDHLAEVDTILLKRPCGRTASQDLAEFILSSASLRTMEIGEPMHAVFYSMLADKAQQCQIQNLNICFADLIKQPRISSHLAEFICQMPRLKSLEFCYNKPHEEFFSKWASTVSTAKGNNSTTPHISLRELIVDGLTVFRLQSCGDMFNSLEKLSICFCCDFKCSYIQRLHEFQGVTELSIIGSVVIQPCRVKGKPSTMIKHLVRVFPQLIKLTFRIHLSNAILKQILKSLRKTHGFPLKSVSIMRCGMDDGRDELDALINRINDENIYRVEVEPIRDRTYYGHYRDRMWLTSGGAHKKAHCDAVNDAIPRWHEKLLLLLIFICDFVWYQKDSNDDDEFWFSVICGLLTVLICSRFLNYIGIWN
eukprot:XP_011678335.1 PREDICTED: uncharacterized protein LOC105445025 [Strongylocentrotus purpuratus]